jgi:hypothetical protein
LADLNEALLGTEFSKLVMLLWWLDCCHSGFLVKQGLLRQMFGAFDGKDYVLLTACRGSEQAFAEASADCSVFSCLWLCIIRRECQSVECGLTYTSNTINS